MVTSQLGGLFFYYAVMVGPAAVVGSEELRQHYGDTNADRIYVDSEHCSAQQV